MTAKPAPVTPKNIFPVPVLWTLAALILAGILMRIIGITRDQFYFFDSGMYLNYGRILLQSFDKASSKNLGDFLQAIHYWVLFAFRTDRPLWQLIVDARILWGWTEVWHYSRMVSAGVGITTLAVTYCFAKKFFQSKAVGLLSAAVLAILPSHIFYSRLGLPEATTTLLFLLGLYFYFFSKGMRLRVILSGFFFLCAFLTNYRLALFPLLLLSYEAYISFSEKRPLDLKKWGLCSFCFLFLLLPIAFLNNGIYFQVTSNWILHQAVLAKSNFAVLNLLSYPYQLFRLESTPFALVFFGNVYFLFKKDWRKLFPFFLVCLQMAIFTFSMDKAARYLSIATPFMAMAAAILTISLVENYKEKALRNVIISFSLLTAFALLTKALPLLNYQPHYQSSVQYLKTIDPHPMVVSTQSIISNLFTEDRSSVIPCPDAFDDKAFLQLPEQGFRYLAIGPQAFVSWTDDGLPFSENLGGFLGFVDQQVAPIKTLHHLNRATLERFVFEHNQNLWRSINFLESADERATSVRIYDLPKSIELLQSLMQQHAAVKTNHGR